MHINSLKKNLTLKMSVFLLGLTLSSLICTSPSYAQGLELVKHPEAKTMAPKGWIMKFEQQGPLSVVQFEERPGAIDTPMLSMIHFASRDPAAADRLYDSIIQMLNTVKVIKQRRLGNSGRFVELTAKTDKNVPCRMAVIYVTSDTGIYLAFFVAPRERFATLGGVQLLLSFSGLVGEGEAVGGFPKPTKKALKIAKKFRLPSIPQGGMIAGPFDRPNGMIFYLGQDSRISIYDPKKNQVFFGRMNPNGWSYATLPNGYHKIENLTPVKIRTPPPEMGLWPMAVELSKLCFNRAKKKRRARRRRRSSGVPWGVMSNMSRMMHQTNMQIINNIGGSGCINRYEGPFFVGCW
jgi:hypothetical protein